MVRRTRLAQALAIVQLADLVVAQTSPTYGTPHLDHLGVPTALRPLLPIIKGAAIVALLVVADRPTARSLVAAGLVSYYSAATTFHVLAGDPAAQAMPAAAMAAGAAALA